MTTTPPVHPLSIWSLVLGCVSLFICPLIGGIAALVTGSKAKKAIAESGGTRGGRGLAVAGQVLGVINLVLSVVAGVILIVFLANSSHHVAYTKLATGDCFDRDSRGVFSDRVTKVSCAKPHLGEVVGSFSADNGPWPGPAGIRTIASERCSTMATQYAGLLPSGLDVYFLYPKQSSWNNGTRLVVCELHNQDNTKRVGSSRSSGP